MTYEETVDYLYHAAPMFSNIGAGAYKEGLATTLALDEHFGHPHRRFRTIHVAGTNGKGSVSSTLAAILQSAGLKVGLYTSPLVDDNSVSIAETILNARDLYDATAKENKVKIVTLTVNQPEVSEVYYLCTTPMENGVAQKDVRPANNVLPVSLVGKWKLGDTNHDTFVNMTDAQNVVNTVLGKPVTGNFFTKSADVSRDGKISISDAVGIVNMILKK